MVDNKYKDLIKWIFKDKKIKYYQNYGENILNVIEINLDNKYEFKLEIIKEKIMKDSNDNKIIYSELKILAKDKYDEEFEIEPKLIYFSLDGLYFSLEYDEKEDKYRARDNYYNYFKNINKKNIDKEIMKKYELKEIYTFIYKEMEKENKKRIKRILDKKNLERSIYHIKDLINL